MEIIHLQHSEVSPLSLNGAVQIRTHTSPRNIGQSPSKITIISNTGFEDRVDQGFIGSKSEILVNQLNQQLEDLIINWMYPSKFNQLTQPNFQVISNRISILMARLIESDLGLPSDSVSVSSQRHEFMVEYHPLSNTIPLKFTDTLRRYYSHKWNPDRYYNYEWVSSDLLAIIVDESLIFFESLVVRKVNEPLDQSAEDAIGAYDNHHLLNTLDRPDYPGYSVKDPSIQKITDQIHNLRNHGYFILPTFDSDQADLYLELVPRFGGQIVESLSSGQITSRSVDASRNIDVIQSKSQDPFYLNGRHYQLYSYIIAYNSYLGKYVGNLEEWHRRALIDIRLDRLPAIPVALSDQADPIYSRYAVWIATKSIVQEFPSILTPDLVYFPPHSSESVIIRVSSWRHVTKFIQTYLHTLRAILDSSIQISILNFSDYLEAVTFRLAYDRLNALIIPINNEWIVTYQSISSDTNLESNLESNLNFDDQVKQTLLEWLASTCREASDPISTVNFDELNILELLKIINDHGNCFQEDTYQKILRQTNRNPLTTQPLSQDSFNQWSLLDYRISGFLSIGPYLGWLDFNEVTLFNRFRSKSILDDLQLPDIVRTAIEVDSSGPLKAIDSTNEYYLFTVYVVTKKRIDLFDWIMPKLNNGESISTEFEIQGLINNLWLSGMLWSPWSRCLILDPLDPNIITLTHIFPRTWYQDTFLLSGTDFISNHNLTTDLELAAQRGKQILSYLRGLLL